MTRQRNTAEISERRRERKDSLRTERERHAERAVQQMIFALDRIPEGEAYDEWRSHVHAAVTRIRRSAKRTPDRDLDAVKAAMGKPLVQTAEDIAEEAGLPRKDVEKILSAMVATGAAVCRPRLALVSARGPKVWLYFLTGEEPFSDRVVP